MTAQRRQETEWITFEPTFADELFTFEPPVTAEIIETELPDERHHFDDVEKARGYTHLPVPEPVVEDRYVRGNITEIRGECPRPQSLDESDHIRHNPSLMADRGLMKA